MKMPNIMNDEKTLKKLAYAVSTLLVCLVIIWGVNYWRSHQTPKTVTYDPLKFNYSLPLAFHPDSVLSLRWQVADKSFAFTRKDRLATWSPAVDPHLLQDKLNVLSMIHQTSVSKVATPLVQIKLQFNDKTEWSGAFDGRYFMWTSGPMQGKGADLLNAAEELYFREGRFAFEPTRFDWCHGKVMKIDFNGEKNISLARTAKGGWQLTRFGVSTDGDATKIEKWLGAHCYVAASHFVDTALGAENKKSKTLTKMQVHFEDESAVTFQVAPAGIISREGFDGAPAFVSADFVRGLQSLLE